MKSKTEPLFTKAEVYALPLPQDFLLPLGLPLDTDVPALMKAFVKLKATQQTTFTPPASVDDKEFHDRAIKKLFDGEPPSDDDTEPSPVQ